MQQRPLKKILIINPYGIGDVLFTTPLIENLKKAYPQSYLSVLVGSRTREILEINPKVDSIFVFDKGKFDRLSLFKGFAMLFKLIRQLRREKFDLLIDLSNSSQYGFFEKFFLNIPQRIGFNYRDRGRFLTTKVGLKGYTDKHVVDYYLDLMQPLGIKPQDKQLKFPLSKEDYEWAKNFLKDNNLKQDELIIGIIPGGGSSWGPYAKFKRWGKEKFAELSDRLIKNYKARIIVMGSEDEKDLCYYIRDRMKQEAIFACGSTNLRQFAALCSLCKLIVCNDGGPLHIAVSQKIPTVSIFGPVDDKVYGPYPKDDKHRVVKKDIACRPCYKNFRFKPCKHRKCLTEIKADDILKEINFLFKKLYVKSHS